MLSSQPAGHKESVDLWLDQWESMLRQWLTGGLQYPGTRVKKITASWLSATRAAGWEEAAEQGETLLNDEQGEEKIKALKTLLILYEQTSKIHGRQSLKDNYLCFPK